MGRNNEEYVITDGAVEKFRHNLITNERADSTVKKYVADVNKLKNFAGGGVINKELMMAYKDKLINDGYTIKSVNSFIAAANAFIKYMGWNEMTIKQLKLQDEVFVEDSKELSRDEYKRLVMTAKNQGNIRLAMILVVICSTGIRISELSFLTVEAVSRGRMTVNNKGKHRTVILTRDLIKALRLYIADKKIRSGSIFCTSGGSPVDRSNVWREMKKLCKNANVDAAKVFPHNLRHLFARLFFASDKDIAKLADILGHGSIETTRIYLRKSTGEYLDNIRKMGVVINLFKGVGEGLRKCTT